MRRILNGSGGAGDSATGRGADRLLFAFLRIAWFGLLLLASLPLPHPHPAHTESAPTPRSTRTGEGKL